MKKILLGLLILLITGCVSNGELSNECIKVEESDELISKTTYKIDFKNDIISNVVVTKEYISSKETIDAIKLSTTTQNNFWKDINFNILLDDNTSYKVEYIFDVNNTSKEVYNYFNLRKERSKQVNTLKEMGYVCE